MSREAVEQKIIQSIEMTLKNFSGNNLFFQGRINCCSYHAWNTLIYLMQYTQNFLTICIEVSGTTLKDFSIVLIFGMSDLVGIVRSLSEWFRSSVFTDVTATVLKANAIGAYPVFCRTATFYHSVRTISDRQRISICRISRVRPCRGEHEKPGSGRKDMKLRKICALFYCLMH